MLSYILLISCIGGFAFFESSGFKDKSIKQFNDISRYVALGILLVFIGLRYKVGADWLQYYTYYENVENIWTVLWDSKNAPFFYEHTWEPGFKLLMCLGKSIGIEFEIVIFLITTFNLYSLNRFLKQNLKTNANLFLVFLLALNMLREFDILRQSLAFSILLFAYPYVGKNFIKYFLVCLTAFLFHTSAIIFIPIYWFLGMKVNRNFIIFTFTLFVSSLVLRLRILSMLVGITEKILPEGPSSFFLHQVYAYLEVYNKQSNINLVALLCLLILIMLIAFYKKIILFDHRFLVAFLIFVYTYMLFSEIGEIQSRFGYYFTIGIAYCISGFVALFRPYVRMAYIIFMILYADIKIILPFRLEATLLTYTPYRNYLFHLDRDEQTEQEILVRHALSQEKSQDLFDEN